MRILTKIGLAAAATLGMASAASAQSVLITGATGTYGNNNVTCPANAALPCNFTDSITFVTPTGYNSASLDITSIFNGTGTDINFTSVLFNGVAYNLVLTGVQEFRNIFTQPLVAGATNEILINGTSGGNASYSGTIALANTPAVPEPATWAMMLAGFGMIGFSMRRRRSSSQHLLQAA